MAMTAEQKQQLMVQIRASEAPHVAMAADLEASHQREQAAA